MTEKSNAHSDWINSVAFSPDGKSIVSGSRDQTIKVWGFRPFLESEWEEVDISAMPKDEDGEVEIDGLGYISSNYWRNVVTGDKEKNRPSGGAWCSRHPQSLEFRRALNPKPLVSSFN